ncbi:MAG: carbohydrate ABC transporter permease [Trueperaceae bacterium]|nr:carbohydrate ABC transporter permease [Trueperaceae bacterium]
MLRTRAKNLPLYLLHVLLAILFLAPLVWAVSTSLKHPGDIMVYPPTLLPSDATLTNYLDIWTVREGIFRRYFLNSVIVSVGTAGLVALVSVLAGYGFAVLRFRAKEFLFVAIVAAMLIPFQALLVPLFQLVRTLGLLNTYAGLIIIYTTFQLPFGVFMMRNAFATVPVSLRESALLDGASELVVAGRVMLPLVLPGVVTTVIYSLYITWNEFLIALVFTTDESMKLLTVGLRQLATGRYTTNWEYLTSGAIISFIPIMIVFLFLQRYFISGVTGGAVKG